MSRSYIETVRTQLARREELVAQAIAHMRQIVNGFVEVDAGGVGRPLRTRAERWNGDGSGEYVWFNLYGDDGNPLEEEDVENLGRVGRKVASAALQFADGMRAITAFTVEVQPPNVRGHDGTPLASSQIVDVLSDLKSYETALEQTATVTPAII